MTPTRIFQHSWSSAAFQIPLEPYEHSVLPTGGPSTSPGGKNKYRMVNDHCSSCHSRRWRDHRINDFYSFGLWMWTVVQFQMYFPQQGKIKNLLLICELPPNLYAEHDEDEKNCLCQIFASAIIMNMAQNKKNRKNFNQHTLTRKFCLSENHLRESIKSIFPPICRLGAGSQASMAPNKSCMMDHLQTIESNQYIDQTALQ